MSQIYSFANSDEKSKRYTWSAKIFIAMVLVGCVVSVYALVKIIMGGH